jgi:hypothetical protein
VSHADRDRVVDILRLAAADGRITAAELDERVEAALAALTSGELAVLTADLPIDRSRDLVQIRQFGGFITRKGRWVVPRRMRMRLFAAKMKLDFTNATITQDTLRIDLQQQGGFFTLVIKPGIVVDVHDLTATYGRVSVRADTEPNAPVTLRVELVGHVRLGHVVVRFPWRRGA